MKPVIGGTGNSLTALKLFEAQIIPALLHNCESWIGINQTHQKFQDKYIRKLLWLPQTTPESNIALGCRFETHEVENCREETIFCKIIRLERTVTLQRGY